MFEKIGGRKFVYIILILSIGTAVDLLTERGLSSNLLYLLMGGAGIYVTGNVVKAKVDGKGGKTSLEKRLDERDAVLLQYLEAINGGVTIGNQGLETILSKIPKA